MKKVSIMVIVIFATLFPLASVAGDSNTPGDDLIETVFYGTVADSLTGLPIEKADVYAYDINFNYYQHDVTDYQGFYYLEFDFGGEFFIYVEADYYQIEETTQSIMVNDKIEIDFNLTPIQYDSRIIGQVTYEDTVNPLKDVLIKLYEAVYDGELGYDIGDFKNDYTTSEDGTYSFKVDTGKYYLNFYKEGYYGGYTYWLVDVPGHESEFNMQLWEYRCGVYGQVTDESGDPLSGVVVQLKNDNYFSTNITDDGGMFEVRIPYGGTYTLSAYADDYRLWSEEVDCGEDELIHNDIQLQKTYLPDPMLRFLYYILEFLGLL